ncbi:UDP-N-acetylglucosamine 2-epimerase [Brevundimonas kwangchunensis]|uniref:UDP-N-acetylglucosamine 2-epimerase n=1 Tax=Brevundimonas kwangchunensis TaxID=322163 RepID=A0ABN1GGU5_9CAUL
MSRNKRICVATSGRADYGLLLWPMRDIAAASDLDLQVLVTGSHLEERFGRTVDQILADGLPVTASVPMALTADDPVTLARASAHCVVGTAEALAALQPDILLVLGDRYETLAIVQAAMLTRTPVAHIGGGDVTEGAIDEGIRHAITKLAHIHLATHRGAAGRIVQMGESPDRVHIVGSPALDNLRRIKPLERNVLERRLGRSLASRNLLVTFHPVTTLPDLGLCELSALLESLSTLPEDIHLWFTRANADPGGVTMNERLERFVRERANTSLHDALGPLYLPLLAACDAVVGNSSSGLGEAPSVRTPTVDIGFRQQGRLAGPSVIQCAARPDQIEPALYRALAGDVPGFDNPYGDGHSSARIVQVLRTAPPQDILLRKRFFDGDSQHG